MQKFLTQLKEKRIWRVLVAYPSMTFVLLQAVEFFINNYGIDKRFLTAAIVVAIILFPAAVIWNWRHGEVGHQAFTRTEIGAYGLSVLAAVAAANWYWTTTPIALPDGGAPAEPVRLIAVLPFENAGGDADVQYLCDGIAESLINWLATVPDIKVVSKGASFRLREKRHDTAAIAAKLGADSVIFGNLELVGDQIVVSVSMVDVRDNSQIWGARMVQPSQDVIFVERSIVASIKDELRLKVHPDARAMFASGGTDNPEAYQHYLRGHYLIQSTNGEQIKQGIEELRQAIRLDPNFARPYADIADSLTQMLYYGVIEGEELLGEARNAAYSAIALAPGLAEAHTALATIHQYFDFDWAATEQAYEKAISLSPLSPGPFHRYTDYLALTYRLEKAGEMAARAIEIDALDSSSMHAVGLVHMISKEYAEAARTFGEWNRFHPSSRWSYVKHALALSMAGRCEEAAGQAEKVEAMNNGGASPLMESWLAWGYRICGDETSFNRSKERIEAVQKANPNPRDPGLAYLYAIEGNVDSLVDSFEQIEAEGSPFALFMKLFSKEMLGWGVSGKMAVNPRFQVLLARMDFPPEEKEQGMD